MNGEHEQSVLCSGGAACHDCGLSYEEFGLDITLLDDQWLTIFPEQDGLLCGTCIARRAAALPAALAIRAVIEFAAPDVKEVHL